MRDDLDPAIRIFKTAAWHDRKAGAGSAYDALKAAGSPYAECYKSGWNEIDEIVDAVLRALPAKRGR